MAEFNAGSIEATLTLNRDPFTRGLELAKEQARRFEDDPITAHLRVDDGDSAAKIATLKAELDAIHDKTVHVTVDTDRSKFDEAARGIEGLASDVEDLGTKSNIAGGPGGIGSLGSAAASAGGPGGGIGLMGAGIAALVPLLDPILGFGLGAVSSMGVAATGLGSFALFAIPTFKQIGQAQKDVTKAQDEIANATTMKQKEKALKDLAAAEKELNGPMGQVLQNYQALTKEFDAVQKQVAPGIATVFNEALKTAQVVLPMLTSVVDATSSALASSIDQVRGFLTSPVFSGFIDFVSKNIGPVMQSLTTTVLNYVSGFMSLIQEAKPLMDAFDNIMVDMSEGFKNMVLSPGFKDFINAMAAAMPAFEKLGSDIFKTLGDVLVHLEPLVGPGIQFLDALVKAVDTLITGGSFDALIRLLNAFLQALIPALPAIANMINSVIVPLANALVPILQALTPLMPIIGPVVVALLSLRLLEGPLGRILGIVETLSKLRAGEGMGGMLGKILGPGGSTAAGQLGGTLLGGALGAFGGSELAKYTEPGKGPGATTGRTLTTVGGGLIGAGAGMAATGVGVVPGAITAGIGAALIGAGEVTSHWKGVSKFFNDQVWQPIDRNSRGTFRDVENWSKSAFGHVEGFFKNIGHDVTNWSKNVGGAFSQFFAKDIPNWSKSAGSHITGFFVNIGHDVSNWSTNVGHAFGQFFTKDIPNWASSAGSHISGFFVHIGHDVSNWAQNAGKSIGNFFTHDIPNWANNAWHAVSGAFSNIGHDIGQAFVDAKNTVIGFFSDAGTWLLDAGKNIIQGLINGIESMAGSVVKGVEHIGGGIIHSISTGFGLWSPSKLMHGFGVNIAQGLANGIAAGADAVSLASDKMNAAVQGPAPIPLNVNPASRSGASMGNVNITIHNPVGETTDTTLHRTMQKIRFHGLLPPELWDVKKAG